MNDENSFVEKYNPDVHISNRKKLKTFFSIYFGSYLVTFAITLFAIVLPILFPEGFKPPGNFHPTALLGCFLECMLPLILYPSGVTGLFLADSILPFQLLFGYVVYISIFIAFLKQRKWKIMKTIITIFIVISILNIVGCIRMVKEGAFFPGPF